MIETMSITPVNVHSAPNGLSLVPWAEAIRNYPNDMLPVSKDQLQRSFDSDMAAVLINSDKEVVGGAKFTPLLDQKKKEELGLLGLQLPDIWEMGSIISMGEARGNGFSRSLNEKLLEPVRERIKRGELLILGTTKTIFLANTLLKIDLGTGGKFSLLSQDELPMVAPLTCVCKKPLGTGFQMSPNCEYRIRPDQDPKSLGNNLKGKIPCTLFISNIDLARRTDSVLKAKFSAVNPSNPQGALVAALQGIGYYR